MEIDPLRKLGMHAGAENLIFLSAEKLRGRMTREEETLWNYLKNKPNGHKWRRQHPLALIS